MNQYNSQLIYVEDYNSIQNIRINYVSLEVFKATHDWATMSTFDQISIYKPFKSQYDFFD